MQDFYDDGLSTVISKDCFTLMEKLCEIFFLSLRQSNNYEIAQELFSHVYH